MYNLVGKCVGADTQRYMVVGFYEITSKGNCCSIGSNYCASVVTTAATAATTTADSRQPPGDWRLATKERIFKPAKLYVATAGNA